MRPSLGACNDSGLESGAQGFLEGKLESDDLTVPHEQRLYIMIECVITLCCCLRSHGDERVAVNLSGRRHLI